MRRTLFEAFKKTFEDPEFKKAFEAFGRHDLCRAGSD